MVSGKKSLHVSILSCAVTYDVMTVHAVPAQECQSVIAPWSVSDMTNHEWRAMRMRLFIQFPVLEMIERGTKCIDVNRKVEATL